MLYFYKTINNYYNVYKFIIIKQINHKINQNVMLFL